MKKLLSILLILIGAQEVLSQSKEIQELPFEKDTIINGIETKIVLLKIKGQINEGNTLTDVIIGFRNPETKEWIWFDATNVPIDPDRGFTHSFPLKLKNGYEGKDIKFLNPIVRHEKSSIMWRCSCNKVKQKRPV